jgi:EAL domain-containing protein (putative c-di-GMP-specific phosphodiesterase class I)
MEAGQPGTANTAESLGWQLRGALPPMRLHSVSVYDSNADILWLSEGALGPDEHGFVMEALNVLGQDAARAYWDCNLEDGRGAVFLAVRAPQGDLVGLVMILADVKSLTAGVANRILIAPVRAVLQRMAILLRPPQAPLAPPVVAAPVVPPVVPATPVGAKGKDAENHNFVPDAGDVLDFAPVVRADTPDPESTAITGTAETLPADVVDEILSFELVDEPSVAPSKPAPGATPAELWRRPPQSAGADLPVPPQLIPELKPQDAPPFAQIPEAVPFVDEAEPQAVPHADHSGSEVADNIPELIADEAPELPAASGSYAVEEPLDVPSPVAEAVPHDASQVLPAPTVIPVPDWPKVEPVPEAKAAPVVEPAATGLHTVRSQKIARPESELIHDDMPEEAVPRLDTLPGEFVLYVREITKLRTGGQTRRYEVTLRSASDPTVEMPPDALSEAAAATDSLYPDVLIAAELVAWLAHNPQPADGNGEPVSFIIDVTAAALQDPEFPQLIAGQLGHADIATESIGFRISEATCVQHKPQVARFITACEKLECFIVLDDFTLHSGAVDFLRSKALRLVMVDPKLTAAAVKDKVAQALVVAICQAGKVPHADSDAARTATEALLIRPGIFS